MYGPGQNEKSLVAQLESALAAEAAVFNMSGGEQVRDFLPVERMAEYIVCAALQQEVTGIINCCSGRPVTVRQFVEEYLAARGISIRLNLGYYPYPDYEPMRFWGDAAKIHTIIQHTNHAHE
jgi:dTDP-6-deoxy-L-talose 4-dehydrogenase (NAD+)